MEVEYYKKWNKGSGLKRKTPLKAKKGLSPFGKKRKRRAKNMSQLDVFHQIWEERPHICENCGKPIREFDIRHFAHIRTKSAWPSLALDPRNIALACRECHHKDHNDPEFEWSKQIQRRADRAKREYYNQES